MLVHEINIIRNANGEFSTLCGYLLRDESKFKQIDIEIHTYMLEPIN